MIRKGWIVLTLLLVLAFLIPGAPLAETAPEPVVQAVLFYSPTCPHCHDVINNLLMPMMEQYGESLQIIGVDTSQQGGQMLYQAAIQRFEIPQERLGVPTLIVGETILVGSLEIPNQFPGIVEEGLAGEGIGWPDIPGLDAALTASEEAAQETEGAAAAEANPAAQPEQPVETAGESAAPAVVESATEESVAPASAEEPVAAAEQPSLLTEEQSLQAAEAGQPDGFELATVVLILLVLALGVAVIRIVGTRQVLFKLDRPLDSLATTWAIPLLAVLGLGVSIYLAYIEITLNEAVCGPVGDCNAVQASEYARIAGIPVAVLGVINYIGILILWLAQSSSNRRLASLAGRGLLALTLFGVLFSIYLTLLELFVIHAVCAWCLSSALITAALMLLALWPMTNRSPAARERGRPQAAGI